MIDLDLIKNFSIDKSDWAKVKFGDIAYEPKESVKDPVAEGIEHVVGLEHIDSEDIHLRRSSHIDEASTTFTKRFRKGDVLFGRRRAYLKKAAKADFDGICSGDITVMRANEELLLPELLPFIVNNDKFFDYAIEHSAGGLSPRVKFKDLALYELSLPPKDDQLKIIKLLLAMDTSLDIKKNVLSKVEKLKYIECVQAFNDGSETNRVDNIRLPNNRWEMKSIRSVIPDIEYGISISIPKNQDDNGIPIISTAEIDRDGKLKYEIIRSIKYEKVLPPRLVLSDGDLLFNWRNSLDLIGKSTIFYQPNNEKKYTFASFILRLRCNEKDAHNYYFKYLLNYYREVGIFVGMARKAVNQANFNKNEVYDLLVPVPSYEEQKKIAARIKKIDDQKYQIIANIDSSKKLLQSLINQVF